MIKSREILSMEINVKSVPISDHYNLDRASAFVLEMLNQVGDGGDFVITDRSDREVVLSNTGLCASFCSKKKSCDVKFCDQRQREIQQGLKFIDNRLTLAITACANLSDGHCEIKLYSFS